MGVKEYKLPNGRKAVFKYDEYGVGKVTLEAMDLLMEMVNIDLVRCGECKQLDHTKWCDLFLHYMNEDDFCSYGERRANYTVFTVNLPKGIETPLKGNVTVFHQKTQK